VLTLFPEMFSGPMDAGILQRARASGLLDLRVHNLRDYTHDNYKSVDDRLLHFEHPEAARHLSDEVDTSSVHLMLEAVATGNTWSNLGPTNPALLDEAKARIAALKAADPTNTQLIPVDLVTSSGSGLDPDISVAAVLYQLPRVARLRGLSESAVRALVNKYTQGRTLGFLGEPTVNVLQLNLALDVLKP